MRRSVHDRSRYTCSFRADADGLLPAIVKTWGYVVATRDVDSFRDAKLTVINPWGC